MTAWQYKFGYRESRDLPGTWDETHFREGTPHGVLLPEEIDDHFKDGRRSFWVTFCLADDDRADEGALLRRATEYARSKLKERYKNAAVR